MTDTPRTDEALRKANTIGQEVSLLTDLARQLERELAHMAGLLAGQLRFNASHPMNKGWERWYAWHPVKVEGKWAWRRYVERTFCAALGMDFWTYREPKPPCRGCEAERTGDVLMDANYCPVCDGYPWGSNEFHTCRGFKECPECHAKELPTS